MNCPGLGQGGGEGASGYGHEEYAAHSPPWTSDKARPGHRHRGCIHGWVKQAGFAWTTEQE